MQRILVVLVTAALMSACATTGTYSKQAVVQTAVPDVQVITDSAKLAKYAMWYAEVERCSGKMGDFSGVTFYVSKAHLHNNRTFDGYWEQESRSIVLRNDWDESAGKHEMMHDILRNTQHPIHFFNGVCGDLTRGEVF
jgi:hypothetical protein